MGLRSRQRRIAGLSHEQTFDPETSKHIVQSLDEHLIASRKDVDSFNLLWKKRVAMAGFVVILYELTVLHKLLTSDSMETSNIYICVALKSVSIASIFFTQQYLWTGTMPSFGASLFFSGGYFVITVVCASFLHTILWTPQVSPICFVYFIISHGALRAMGNNTKAELARAEQLEKLEQLFNTCKD